jgi:uncharacterized membrane protein YesL
VASRADTGAEGRWPATGTATGVPRLATAVRASLSDYYFHSVRLVPVNLVWGAGALIAVVIGWAWPLGGLAALALLPVPAAAVFALGAAIVRGSASVGVRDAIAQGRAAARRVLPVGVVWLFANLVLLTNVATGIAGGSALGWVVSVSAAWGLAILWCGAVVLWPLLLDPAHPDRSVADDLRLAATLLLVDPIRFGALGVFTGIVVVVSTILTVALPTISVSFLALVACRSVYPVADRVEPRLTRRTH